MMYVDIGQFIPRLHGEYMPLMSRRISLSITYDIWHECKHKVTCHNQYQTDTIHVHHPNPNEIVYEEEFEESDHIIACSVVDKAVNHSIASRSLVKFLQNKDLLRHYHRINWWLLLCIVHHWYNDYIRVSHGIEEAGCINKYCTIGIRRPFM
eukprot:767848_1